MARCPECGSDNAEYKVYKVDGEMCKDVKCKDCGYDPRKCPECGSLETKFYTTWVAAEIVFDVRCYKCKYGFHSKKKCPVCGSHLIISKQVHSPLSYGAKVYLKCDECGFDFRKKPNDAISLGITSLGISVLLYIVEFFTFSGYTSPMLTLGIVCSCIAALLFIWAWFQKKKIKLRRMNREKGRNQIPS
ncbi:MAG: hypothetical protein ACFFCS_02590 [Candidatus Hodarchaeota archaeon]